MERDKKTIGQAIDEIISTLQGLDESDRATVIRASCEHLRIVPSSISLPQRDIDHVPGIPPTSANPTIAERTITDIRSLKDEKKPGRAIEMVCIVAYYLESLAPPEERKQEISSPDLEKYFKQAGYPLPSRMRQVLASTKDSGYLDSTGHGRYRLNPVGHNLVVHSLPRNL